MTQYLLPLLFLSALCGGWVLFQGWLAKQDKTYRGYKAGCGACGSGSCDTEKRSCGVDDGSLSNNKRPVRVQPGLDNPSRE